MGGNLMRHPDVSAMVPTLGRRGVRIISRDVGKGRESGPPTARKRSRRLSARHEAKKPVVIFCDGLLGTELCHSVTNRD